jgi:hypothetical protein
LLDELEFEFDELLELELLEEFEFELLEEFELEFDEPFEDELLDEFEELLPATMIDPSLLAVFAPTCLTSGAAAEYCLASTAVVASAATPATRADLNFQYFVMGVTPLSGPSRRPGGVTGVGELYSLRLFRAVADRCKRLGLFFHRQRIARLDRGEIGVERFA